MPDQTRNADRSKQGIDDIVTRLRDWSQFIQESDPFSYRAGESADLQREAADEIERLRADYAEAYDACRYALANSPRWRENAATVVATWEARRG